MCGHIIKYEIRIDHIRERVGVAPIVEKMVENRFRWFDHVQRKQLDAPIRRVDQIMWSPSRSGRGRRKRTFNRVIK